jgi:hypothetical protein
VHAHPLSLCLPSRTKLWCTLQREGRYALNEAESYRGLDQHGGPPGLLEESDPAGVILYVVDGPYHLPFPYRTGCPGAVQLRADGISSCCYIVNVHNHPSRKDGMACYSSRPMPSLWIHSLYFYSTTICTLWCRLSLRLSVSVLVLVPSVFLQISTRLIFFNFAQFENLSVRTLTTFSSQSDNQLYTYLSS